MSIGYLAVFASLLASMDGRRLPEAVLVVGTLLLGFAYLALIGAFVYPDGDVASARSTFPNHLLSTPSATWKLAFVPMAAGAVTVGALTLMLTAAVRTLGSDMALWWPTFTLVAILALLQLIFWSPTLFPFSKVVLTGTLVPGLLLGVATAFNTGHDEFTVCTWLAVGTLSAYCATAGSLALARRGDQPILDGWQSRSNGRSSTAPFRTAAEAQRWYEWRQQGLILPILVLVLFALLAVPMFWNSTQTPIFGLSGRSSTAEAYLVPTVPTTFAIYYPALLALLPTAAWVVGCGTRRSEMKRDDGNLHLFFATRPLTELDLFTPKVTAATKSVLASWLLVAVCTIPFLLMSGGLYDANSRTYVASDAPVYRVLLEQSEPGSVAKWAILAVILVAATWRAYVVGFWTEMSGRHWLRYAYPAAVVIGLGLLASLSSAQDPHARWLTVRNLAIAIWCINGIRLAAAVKISQLDLAGRIVSPGRLLRWVLLFGAATFALSTLTIISTERTASDLVSAGAATRFEFQALVVGLTVLWLPIVRLLACPLLLHWNRHRP